MQDFNLYSWEQAITSNNKWVIKSSSEANEVKTGGPTFLLTPSKLINIEITGQSSMVGMVKVIDENKSLVCDSLHFDSPNNILYGFGNSRIWDDDYELKSDTIT